MPNDTDTNAAVAVRDDSAITPQPAPASAQGGTIEMIASIVAKGDLDIDQMQTLLTMRADEEKRIRQIEEEDRARAARAAYLRDLALLQGDIGPIIHDRTNSHTSSSYATLASIEEKTAPYMKQYGFSAQAKTTKSDFDNCIKVTLYFGHKEGHVEEFDGDFPLDKTGSGGKVNKTDIQALGSTKTYARRYLKAEAMDLSFAAEDRDGNAPVDKSPISEDQLATIVKKLDTAKMSRDQLIKHYGGDDNATLENFPAHLYDDAIARLNSRIAYLAEQEGQEHDDTGAPAGDGGMAPGEAGEGNGVESERRPDGAGEGGA